MFTQRVHPLPTTAPSLSVPHESLLSASHAPYWRKQVCFRINRAADIPISLELYSWGTCKAKGAKFSFDSSVFSSLEILSCVLLDPVSKTTARGSFTWSKEKALARLKRRDFRGMQSSSPRLRPGGDDVTASTKRRLGVERPRGSPRRASSCQVNVPSSRQGRCRDK